MGSKKTTPKKTTNRAKINKARLVLRDCSFDNTLNKIGANTILVNETESRCHKSDLTLTKFKKKRPDIEKRSRQQVSMSQILRFKRRINAVTKLINKTDGKIKYGIESICKEVG